MINYLQFLNKAQRAFSKNPTFAGICEKQWQISPVETTTTQPAIFLPGHMEKVTALQEETNMAHELSHISGGKIEHQATNAYLIRRAKIRNGYLYKGALKRRFTASKEPFFHSDSKVILDEAVIACTLFGSRYFGHWLVDDVTLNLAAREISEPLLAFESYENNHKAQYSAVFGVNWRIVPSADCDKLIVLKDVGQNAYKRSRYQAMRDSVSKLVTAKKHPGVMLLRGAAGILRLLENEDEVANFLKSRGFKIIDVLNLSAVEIAQQIAGAEIVVGVEGSQLIHALFSMSQDGAMVALIPPYRFNLGNKSYVDALSMRLAFVVGDASEQGYKINLDDLARTLDMVYAELNRSASTI